MKLCCERPKPWPGDGSLVRGRARAAAPLAIGTACYAWPGRKRGERGMNFRHPHSEMGRRLSEVHFWHRCRRSQTAHPGKRHARRMRMQPALAYTCGERRPAWAADCH
eukprot:scaffold21977_cov32-Tisochrysis_lutea.AAC.1